MAFKNYRLVTIAPWSNSLRTWDGGEIIYQKGKWQFTAFATQFVKIRQTRPNTSGPDLSFNGVHSRINQKPVGIDLYWFHTETPGLSFMGPTPESSPIAHKDNRHTLGIRLYHNKANHYLSDVEFAYQLGKWGEKNIQAYMVASRVRYQFNRKPLKPLAYA